MVVQSPLKYIVSQQAVYGAPAKSMELVVGCHRKALVSSKQSMERQQSQWGSWWLAAAIGMY